MIAKVCDRESRWDTWFENRLVLYVYIYLWQGKKAVLTIVEFEFNDIFYSKFQLVWTFFLFAINFMLKIDFFAQFAVTWAPNE